MEVQSLVDHHVEHCKQQPKPNWATMPHVGPMHVQAVLFGLRWVLLTTPPYLYKRLGLLAGSLPHCQETFCLSTKSWGQTDIFP